MNLPFLSHNNVLTNYTEIFEEFNSYQLGSIGGVPAKRTTLLP